MYFKTKTISVSTCKAASYNVNLRYFLFFRVFNKSNHPFRN